MTVTNGLATAVAFRKYVGKTDTLDDGRLDDALNSASRAVEIYCGRQFYDSGAASARRFVPTDHYTLNVDDFSTTTGLLVKTDANNDAVHETTWATTDYELDPIDGVVDGIAGWPYQQIHAVGSYAFPVSWPGTGRRFTVQVTARWGWTAVPEPVRQATLQVASELFRRRDAPFGVAQTVEFGPIVLSADSVRAVSSLLTRYRHGRNTAAVA